MLEETDWLAIHNLTYKLMEEENIEKMCRELMQNLHHLLDFKAASIFYLSGRGRDHIHGFSNEVEEEYIDFYINEIYEHDYAKNLFAIENSFVYRETDILKDVSRIHTEYYKKTYVENNFHYSVTVYLCYQKKLVGFLTLFREMGDKDFDYRDIYLLNHIKDHIALAVAQKSKRTKMEGANLEEQCEQYGISNREIQVLELLISSDKEIPVMADELCISVNTLRKHIHNIYQKMDVSNRSQLLRKIFN